MKDNDTMHSEEKKIGAPKAHFTEQNSADVVIGQNLNAKNARLSDVMEVITRHLHAAIKEIESPASILPA